MRAAAVSLVVMTLGSVSPAVAEPSGCDPSTASDDRIECTDSDDTVWADSGDDLVFGRGGRDHLDGGAGRDRLFGGRGRDEIHADDGRRDRVNCGKGHDVAIVDEKDQWSNSCEEVLLGN
jgi:hypothetical protein